MNWIDIAILAGLAFFTYTAFHAGLIREVITIVGAVFAVALAGLFYSDLSADVQVAVDDEESAKIIAFAMIFCAVILASQLTASFLKQAASLLALGVFDSVGGAFFGLFKGLVFIEIGLIIAITFATLGLQRAIDHSAFAPFFLDAIPILKFILPGEFKSAIDAF